MIRGGGFAAQVLCRWTSLLSDLLGRTRLVEHTRWWRSIPPGRGEGWPRGPPCGHEPDARRQRQTMQLYAHPGASVKPYDIQVQRLKAMKHVKGLIEIDMDALVMARQVRDDQSGSTCLRLPVDHARTLLTLLKQQFAELDKLQPRSRRSGRA